MPFQNPQLRLPATPLLEKIRSACTHFIGIDNINTQLQQLAPRALVVGSRPKPQQLIPTMHFSGKCLYRTVGVGIFFYIIQVAVAYKCHAC